MTLTPRRGAPLESQRIPLDRRILIRFRTIEWFAEEYSGNLSMTGMFVRSDEPQPAGTPVDFEFRLEEGAPLIRGKGWVVWARERSLGGERPAGMGIEFLELDRESRRLIRRVVRRELPEDHDELEVRGKRKGEVEPEVDIAGEGERAPSRGGWLPLVAALVVVGVAIAGVDWVRGRAASRAAARDSAEPGAATLLPNAASSPGRRDAAVEPSGLRGKGEAEASGSRALEESVLEWARAWSRQDVESYLSSYSADFVPQSGAERREWSESRRRRILAPRSLRVDITGFEVLSRDGDEGAVVRFTQAYRSDTYSDVVTKTMELVRESDGWRIRRERSE